MNLVSLNIESIQLGHPLPFVLRGADGVLLAQKGYVIRTREELAKMVGRGRQLCVDTDESGDSHRAYLAQLQRMLIADTNLGEIAAMTMTAADDADTRARSGKTQPDWPELQLRATQLLRSPSTSDFSGRFQALHDELVRHCEQTPDATLLALIYLSAQETRMYSATHSMLVCCVCMVVAREMLRWPASRVQQLGHAALSMNIAMSELQDQLAQAHGASVTQGIVGARNLLLVLGATALLLGCVASVVLSRSIVHPLRSGVTVANRIAAEHLELAVDDPEPLIEGIRNAGAIFVGRHTPEVIGDYVSGSNHVLPTARSARFSSGLGVLDFMKRTSILGCDPSSLAELSKAAVTLAATEGLDAHGRSVRIRGV